MKPIEIEDIDKLPGIRIKENDTFCFRCHPEVECFNQCCRNLNLFLYKQDDLALSALDLFDGSLQPLLELPPEA